MNWTDEEILAAAVVSDNPAVVSALDALRVAVAMVHHEEMAKDREREKRRRAREARENKLRALMEEPFDPSEQGALGRLLRRSI